jgi:hypothetical protein
MTLFLPVFFFLPSLLEGLGFNLDIDYRLIYLAIPAGLYLFLSLKKWILSFP